MISSTSIPGERESTSTGTPEKSFPFPVPVLLVLSISFLGARCCSIVDCSGKPSHKLHHRTVTSYGGRFLVARNEIFIWDNSVV
jgi:hypothetical protein